MCAGCVYEKGGKEGKKQTHTNTEIERREKERIFDKS